jgi:hypothetical protein
VTVADDSPDRSAPRAVNNVDELRRQLRALGYLDAGVNRFVLAPARGTRGPAVIALLASLRVGLLAALLLGPAAAVGLAGRLPGLVTGPRDAIVVAIYMGALFGAAAAAAAFAASLIVASMPIRRTPDRARTLSIRAGAVVAIACLVYLTLWWRTANAGFGVTALSWPAPVWTGFALAVAVAISLLLGHAVRVTAFASLMAGLPPGEPAADTPRTLALSWRTSVRAAVLAFAGAAALLILTAPDDTGRPAAPPLTVLSAGLRVRLFAIDGFDPVVFEELARAGRVPRLVAAFGSSHARLAGENTRDPARVWTTVATGQPADVHGVQGLETRRVAGLQGSVPSREPSRLGGAIQAATDLFRLTRPGIASRNERRAKTMWEVMSDAGLWAAVVNWWATWPTETNGNIILSDRATLRLEHGGPLDAEITPASVYERLGPRWPAIRRAADDQGVGTLGPFPIRGEGVFEILRRSAELDAIQLALARDVSTPAPDLLAVYLPGLDIAQHALLGGQGGALPASLVAARLDAVRRYYMVLDRMLESSIAPSANVVVMLVSQPGRTTAAADGWLGVSGPQAARADIAGRTTDVMPTVLHLLGVPISDELSGKPLTGLLTTEFAARYPVRRVARYGRPSPGRVERTGQPLDQEMVDRLRSLGYVK